MRVHHVQLAIPEDGTDRARHFWTTLIGMNEVAKPPALEARGGVWLRKGEAELHLGLQTPFAPALKAHPCFEIPDLEDLAARLLAAGHRVDRRTDIAGMDRFFTADPFGNRLEFTAGA